MKRTADDAFPKPATAEPSQLEVTEQELACWRRIAPAVKGGAETEEARRRRRGRRRTINNNIPSDREKTQPKGRNRLISLTR